MENGSGTISGLLLVSLITGPILGFFILYHIPSYLTKWTGRWIGGKASIQEVRLVTLISMIPMIFALLFWIIEVFWITLFGEKRFFTLDDLNIFSTVRSVLYIWTLVTFVRALSEVQGFSIGKAILNAILPLCILLIPLLLVSIALFL